MSATNCSGLNKVLALLTLFFDVGKGYLVVKVSFFLFS